MNINQCAKTCENTAGCNAVEYWRLLGRKEKGICFQCNNPTNASFFEQEPYWYKWGDSYEHFPLVYKKQGINYEKFFIKTVKFQKSKYFDIKFCKIFLFFQMFPAVMVFRIKANFRRTAEDPVLLVLLLVVREEFYYIKITNS